MSHRARATAAGLGLLTVARICRWAPCFGSRRPRGVELPAIMKRVAAAFGVTEKELLGISRLRRVLVPRQVAMYLARELSGLSLPRIGAAFGRDHTTVLHAFCKVNEALASDERLAATVRQLRRELG